MTRTVNEIMADIKALQQELKTVEVLSHIKKNSDFGLNEKLDIFDELYSYALDLVRETIDNEREPKDCDHYLFEKVMETFLGDGVWSIWNKYVR